MKEMSGKMNDVDLIHALRRMAPETGSLHCFGCGYEHKCSLKGCAIIRLAVERLEKLTTLEPNDPLTLEELREMDGQPVFVRLDNGYWGIVDCKESVIAMPGHGILPLSISRGLAYRRKPEEETK